MPWEKRLIGLADLVPVTPASVGSWEALEAAVDRAPQGMRNLFDDSAVWEPLKPGLARKLLWNENTFLLRVDLGATIPGHLHPTVEHCAVVRGRMVVDGQELRAWRLSGRAGGRAASGYRGAGWAAAADPSGRLASMYSPVRVWAASMSICWRAPTEPGCA